MERFDLRLDNAKVTALKRLAGRLSYESGSGSTIRWTDLVRSSIDVMLAGQNIEVPLDGANNETMETK